MLKTLQFQFSLILLATVIITSGLITVYHSAQTTNALEIATESSQRQIVNARADEIENLLLARRLDVLFLAQAASVRRHVNATESLRNLTLNEVERYFRGYLSLYANRYSGICLLNAVGEEVLCLNSDEDGTINSTNTQDNFSNELFFTETMALSTLPGENSVIYISSVLTRPDANNGKPYLALATRLQDDEGIVYGVLMLELPIERIEDILSASSEYQYDLLDKEGNYLLSNRETTSPGGEFSETDSFLTLSPRDGDIILRSPDGILKKTDEHPDSILAYARIRPRGQSSIQWVLVQEIPLTYVSQTVQENQRGSIGLTLFVLFFAAGSAVFASRWITVPLNKLTNIAQHIESDTLRPMTIDVGGTKETQVLGSTLQSMYDNIRLLLIQQKERITALESARNALEESETRYRKLIEVMSEGMILIDEDFSITFTNSPMVTILSAKDDDLVGRLITDFVHADDLSGFKSSFELARQGVTRQFDTRYYRQDGTIAWTIMSFAPFRDSKGTFLANLGMVTDITERTKIEKQLDNQQRQLQAIFENSVDGILLVDDDRRYVNANRAACEMLGYTLEEMLQLKIEDVTAENQRFRTGELWDQFINEGFWSNIYIMRTKEGKEIITEPRAVMNILPGLHLSIIRDASKRFEMERQLTDSEQRFRLLSEMTSDYAVAFRVNDDQNIEREWITENSFHRITGFTGEESRDRGGWSALTHPEDLPRVTRSLRQLLESPVSTVTPYRIVTKSGKIRYMMSYSRSIADATGQVRYIYSASRDTTDEHRALESLRESEARFRRMADSAPVLIWASDTEEGRTYVNSQWLDFTGRLSAQEMDQGWLEGVYPDDVERVQAIYRNAFRDQIPFETEYRLMHHDGTYHWVFDRALPRISPDGTFEGYMGSCIDITEIKQAQQVLERTNEELEQRVAERTSELVKTNHELKAEIERREIVEQELREQEQLLHTLTNHASDLICLHAPEGHYLFVSPSITSMLGYEAQEMYGRSPYDFFHPEDHERIRSSAHIPALAGNLTTIEYRYRKKSGEYTWLETMSTVVIDKENKPAQIVSVSRDISERKQQQQQLEESERFLQSVLDGQLSQVIVLNETGDILAVNAEWRKQALKNGGNPQLVTGTGLNYLTVCYNAVNGARDEALQAAAGIERIMVGEINIYYQEYKFPSDDETYKWYAMQVTRFEYTSGFRVLVTHTDITNQKRVEESIREALQKEKELNQLQAQFFSMVSHEFRNPLQYILGTMERLKNVPERFTETERKERLTRGQEQVLNLNKLLDEILYIGRIQANRLEIHESPINLSAFCNDIIQDIEMVYHVESRISASYDPSIEMNEVMIDPQILQKVLNNLISNAVKYGENRPIHFKVECVKTELMFTVKDQGIGIPPEDQGKLFSSFHRAENTGSIEGTGLGLVIVKEALERYGGRISFESELGVGTTFFVYVPFKPIEADADVG